MTQSQSIAENHKAKWTPMIFIGLGVALIIMDATIVNVILPTIIRDLNIDSISAEWVNAIYSLTFAAFLIVMGRLGDRFGRRKIFILGAVIFAVSSLLAALSTTGAMLIAARALQGIGGSMMSPTSLSLVNALYRGKDRAIAFAFYGATIGGMAAIGPLLGGWLTQTFSWHWSFWINVPIALIIIFGSLRMVTESKAQEDAGSADLVGAILSSVGIATLIFALIEGRNYGWVKSTSNKSLLGKIWNEGSFSPVLFAAIISIVTLVGLYYFESNRMAKNKSILIDFSLFKIPTFGLGSFAGLIISLGEFGILFSLPLYLQSVLGWSSLGSGGLLAVLALGSFVAAPTAGQIANKRNPRFVARLGLVLEIIGIVGIGVFASPSVSGFALGIFLFVYGMGVGYATAQLTGLILADIPLSKSGQASGTQSTARQIGSAMGTAILGTILFVTLNSNTENRLTQNIGVPAKAAAELATAVEKSAGTIIPTLNQAPGSAQIQSEAKLAYTDSIQQAAWWASGFLVLGLLATLALPPGKTEDTFSD